MRNKIPPYLLPIFVFLFSVFLFTNLNFGDLFKSSEFAFNLLISGYFGIGTTVFILLTRLKNELKKQNREFLSTKKSISYLTEKILKSEDLNKKYEKILNFISDIEPTTNLESFMDKVLDFALNLVPMTRFGTAFTSIDGNHWKLVSVKGYDEKFLKKLEFEKKWFEHLKYENTEIKIVKNILGSPRIPEHTREIIKSGLESMPRNSIFGIFRHGDEILGFMTIDYMEENVRVPAESIDLLRFLIKISALFIATKKEHERKSIFQEEMVKSLVRIIELKDKYIKGHSERVANISVKIAKKLGLSDEDVGLVYWAGVTHDIGKVGIPDEILKKPTRLSDEEFEIVKKHAVLGEQILGQMSYLKNLAFIVRHHHERWDGTGYPDGLKEEEIPLLSRILAVADAFDAMTSDRSYRAALSVKDALAEIEKNSGAQFDPEIVRVFLEMFSDEAEETEKENVI